MCKLTNEHAKSTTKDGRNYIFAPKFVPHFKIKPKETGEEMTDDERRIVSDFTSEVVAHETEIVLGNEAFIDRIIAEDGSAAEKLVSRIFKLDKGLSSMQDKRARAQAKLIKQAERLYLKAAEKAGNKRIVKMILSHDPELKDEESLTGINEEKMQVSGEKKVQMDLKDYEEYDKSITLDDVKKIHNIASAFPKKSINAFTSEEIKATQKWAYKFHRELGVKSPFFRAGFGDWRAYDSSPVKIVTIDKGLSVRSGNAINRDTGRKFSWNKEAADESTLNAPKEHKNDILAVASNLSQIVENAILLDTAVSDKVSNRKLDGTSWMHSLYSIVNIDGKLSLIKLFAEEAYSEKQGLSFTRAYILKYIQKIAEFDNGVLPNNGGLTDSPSATTYSISDLFDYVKTFDENFKPNPVNEHLLNADGTPKTFYHQTAEEFTEFDPRHKGAGTNDDGTPFGIFMKPGDNDIGLKGKKQMALYARIVNPLVVNDRGQLEYELKRMSPEHADLLKQRTALSVEYKQKIKDAAKAWSQYAKEYRESHPNATRSEIYEDSTFRKLFDAEDVLAEEWIKKANELSVRCKEVITKTLKDNEYDGVILKKDEGSGGRTVETYIALDPEQVKSATDNIGTFDKKSKDIRFNLKETKIPTREELERKPPMKVIDISTPQTEGSFKDRRKQIRENAKELIKKPYLNVDTNALIFITDKSYTHAFNNLGELQLNAVEHLPELIEVAILTHGEEPTHGSDHTSGVYTFFAAVSNGKTIQPAKLKVKEYDYTGQDLPQNIREYFGNHPQDYAASYDTVVLEVEEIEESPTGSVKDMDLDDPFLDPKELSTISIADLLDLVKGDAKKYVPERTKKNVQWSLKEKLEDTGDFFADDNDGGPVYKVSGGKVRKVIADNTRMKVYTRAESEQIVNQIVSENLSFGELYGSLQGKSRREAIDMLWEGLNSADPGERGKVALDVAEWIIFFILNK